MFFIESEVDRDLERADGITAYEMPCYLFAEDVYVVKTGRWRYGCIPVCFEIAAVDCFSTFLAKTCFYQIRPQRGVLMLN